MLRISIENFQSVREKQEVDLNGITLIYGNNSSGKSIIKDVLSIGSKMNLGPNKAFAELEWVNHYALKNEEAAKLGFCFYGRSSFGNIESSCVKDFFSDFILAVGLEKISHFIALDESDESLQLLYEYLCLSVMKVNYSWGIYECEDEAPLFEKKELYMGSALGLSQEETVNLELLVTIKTAGDGGYRISFNKQHPLILLLEKDLACSIFFSGERIEELVFQGNYHSTRLSGLIIDKYKAGLDSTGEFDYCDVGFLLTLVCTLGVDLFVSTATDMEIVKDIRDRNENVSDDSATDWYALKRMVFDKKISMYSPFYEIDLINKWLSSPKYLNTGYEIDAKFSFLITLEELELLNRDGGKERFLNNQRAQSDFKSSELVLKDISSDELIGFNNVGTGISQVLPILLHLSSPSLFGKSVYMQQPELHLHPKLQADVAQIISEAYIHHDKLRRYVVETHSELLLLRLLKIIRHNSSCDSSLEPNLLLAEDLNVIFALKNKKGITTYKKLRVSKDGDFLDRWPGGFFEERDLEIF